MSKLYIIMQFAFEFKLNSLLTQTTHSFENQQHLRHGFNCGCTDMFISHKIQNGPLKGKVARHLVNFFTKQIRNVDNGVIYRLRLL